MVRIGAVGQLHQIGAGVIFGLTVNGHFEDIAVGDRAIQGLNGLSASDVFEVDDLFFRLGQRIGLEVAHLAQPVLVFTAAFHQASGILVIEVLPPEAEEQGAVLVFGHELLDLCLECLRCLILRIFAIPETGELVYFHRQASLGLQLVQNGEEVLF